MQKISSINWGEIIKNIIMGIGGIIAFILIIGVNVLILSAKQKRRDDTVKALSH